MLNKNRQHICRMCGDTNIEPKKHYCKECSDIKTKEHSEYRLMRQKVKYLESKQYSAAEKSSVIKRNNKGLQKEYLDRLKSFIESTELKKYVGLEDINDLIDLSDFFCPKIEDPSKIYKKLKEYYIKNF